MLIKFYLLSFALFSLLTLDFIQYLLEVNGHHLSIEQVQHLCDSQNQCFVV